MADAAAAPAKKAIKIKKLAVKPAHPPYIGYITHGAPRGEANDVAPPQQRAGDSNVSVGGRYTECLMRHGNRQTCVLANYACHVGGISPSRRAAMATTATNE
ncbi:unnamed protein product [Meganyctiphanes norvegica]|uniref:Uncharacterized protein n=1 Tax=Meganyctiphanes norvegica TaxID=48144 RepID=A0AAV2SII7_MEGNR